jgi:hypothetical protein
MHKYFAASASHTTQHTKFSMFLSRLLHDDTVEQASSSQRLRALHVRNDSERVRVRRVNRCHQSTCDSSSMTLGGNEVASA